METRIVVVEPEGEINIGFIARVAANFGVEKLYLVNPRVEIGEEARRFSAHAASFLDNNTVIVDSLPEALSGVEVSACTSANIGDTGDVLRHPLTPREFAELHGWKNLAIVFGRESVGLTREEIKLCDVLVTIPASPAYPVLNVSHTVAIILYELYVWRTRGFHRPLEYPDKKDYDLFIKMFDDLVAHLSLPEDQAERIRIAGRHMIVKSRVTKGELRLVTYAFSKVLAKLRRCGTESD